jgi:signal transduction histidine kinase
VLLSDSSKKILSSRPLLEIILNILVENAVRNSLDKKVIELGWENPRLFVRDYGKGIPLEERERIFERFYKNGEGKGYGLGLSLARKLARLLNIEIQIESEEGRGSTFYLIPKED